MHFTSPHPSLHLPPNELATLPRLLLDPISTLGQRAQQPILFPPPVTAANSVFSGRPHAKPLSLDAVDALARRVAHGLLSGRLLGPRAFAKGDVIALYTANQHDYVPVVLGIHLAGGVAALCNPSYKPHELAHQLRMTSARAVFTAAGIGLRSPPSDGAQSASSEDTPLSRALQAVNLAHTEDDDDHGDDDNHAAAAIARLDEQPTVLVFEEDHTDGLQPRLLDEMSQDDHTLVTKRSEEVAGTDTAVYCFSSGTSGLPKAVILTHANLVANTIQSTFLLHDRVNAPIETGARFSPDGKQGWYDGALAKDVGRELGPKRTSSATQGDEQSVDKAGLARVTDKLKLSLKSMGRSSLSSETQDVDKNIGGLEHVNEGASSFVNVLPTFHCYGLLIGLLSIHTATRNIILPRFHLETFLHCVQEHRATHSFLVPPILLALAKHPLVDKYDISSLESVASGAASLPDEIAAAVKARLGILCTDGYGQTEMSPIVSLQNSLDVQQAPNTVGRLAPNTEAVVLAADGRRVGTDEEGELLLRGPQMMPGYLRNDEANEKAFHVLQDGDSADGKWLRTGDVVRIDARGYITITDRLKDVIKAKGFQVSPAELEALLFKDARVQDVAVVGTTDPKDGSERPWAFVVSREQQDDESARSILDKVNGQVAGYKKIAGLTWLDALPKSDAGKVLKKNLATR